MLAGDGEAAFHLAFFAPPHVGNLLGDIVPVEFVAGTSTQQIRLLSCPGGNVVFVEVAHGPSPSRSMPACRNSGSVTRRRLRISGPMRRRSTNQRLLPGSQVPPALRTS